MPSGSTFHLLIVSLLQAFLIYNNVAHAETLKVITYATNKSHARNLVDFCNRYELDLTIIGLNKQWHGFNDKIHGFYNFMKSIHTKNNNINESIFLLMDAYDTIPLCSEQLLLSKYYSFEADIIFATAKECFPDPKAENVLYDYYEIYNYYQWFPWFLCPNTGTIMGTYSALLSMLDTIEHSIIQNNGSCKDFEGNMYGKNSESDQRCYTTYLIQHIKGMHKYHSNITIKLDFTHLIFGSLGGMRYFDLDFNYKINNDSNHSINYNIKNKITNNDICVMHGNGVGVIMLRSYIQQINNNGHLSFSDLLARIQCDFLVSFYWFVYVVTKHPSHYLMNNWDIKNIGIDLHSTAWDEETVFRCHIIGGAQIVLIIAICGKTAKLLHNYLRISVFYALCVLILSYICYVCMTVRYY